MTVTDAHAAPRSASDVAKAGKELRTKLPNLSDEQVRKGLVQAGYPEDAVDRWLNEGDPAPTAPKATPAKKKAAAKRSAPAPAKSSRQTLFQAPGTSAGVLLALVAYPAGLAYLRGGGAGFKAWLRAKFLNQTSTDPGIQNELWLTPRTRGGGAAATSFLGLGRGRGRGAPAGGSGAGAAAVAYARSQIGVPYEWGGDGPAAGDKGFDCSGLTKAAWRAAGVSIPRTTTLQLAALHSVSRRHMQPGDLVFPEPTHVQLYAGGGRIIEAPRLGLKVREMPLGVVMAVRRPGSRAATRGAAT